MRTQRSRWGLATLVVAVLLLAGAYLLPWYEFRQSPGAPAAPETRSNATADPEEQAYGPYQMSGDLSEEDRLAAEKRVEILGWIWTGAMALLGLTLVAELAWGTRERTRWPFMAVAFLGFAATVVALGWTYLEMPSVVEHEGVSHAFTHSREGGDVIRTTVGWGFIAGALSLIGSLGYIAFKFATGLQDPAAVQEFTREP